MIRKILAILALSLLCLLPAQAQTTGYMTDLDVYQVKCDGINGTCLSTISIKHNLYAQAKNYCAYQIPEGCMAYFQQFYYSTSPMAVLQAYLTNQIALEAGNTEAKLVSYSNCIIEPDPVYEGNASCELTIARWQPVPGTDEYGWVNHPGGKDFSFLFRRPTGCPGSGKYNPGKGCYVDSWSEGDEFYKTVRAPLVGMGNCKTCPPGPNSDPELAANPSVGNPVDISSGAKFESQTDITFPITFNRKYSSLRTTSRALGKGWGHQFEKSLSLTYDIINTTTVIGLQFNQENDNQVIFTRDTALDPFTVLLNDQKGYSLSMSGGSYVLSAPDGSKEYYNSTGQLTKILYKDASYYNLAYLSGKLSTITNQYGQTLSFVYSGSLISQVTASNGDYMDYTYSSGLLTQAKFNNSETLQYGYTGGFLSSKTDAKGQTYAFYTYDTAGKVTEEKHLASPTLEVSKYQFTYGIDNVSVTLPDSSTSSYDLVRVNYLNKTQNSSIAGGENSSTVYYDFNGNVNSFNDGVNSGSYVYDSGTNLLTYSNFKGVQTNYTWDTTKRRVTSLESTQGTVVKNVALVYDANGNVTQKTISSGTQSRVWNKTYGSYGKVLTSKIPMNSTTTFTYYSDADSNSNKRGLPYTIKNAVGHILTITSYDNRGNPTGMTLPDGLTKTMTYDQRGRLLTETKTNGTVSQTNTYTYDANGQMTQAQLANGYIMNMTYDMDHRLTGMTDNRNNSLVYTLDTNGNAINESEYTNSVLVSVKNKVFDNLSRISQISRTSSAYPYTYTYDKSNRVTNVQNPNNDNKGINYDIRDNVVYMSGMGRAEILIRDDNDNVTTYYQENNITNFTYDNFSEMLSMTSNDTGNHSYTYNLATRTRTYTDNSGTVETSIVDAIGRPTKITRVNGGVTQTQTLVWDTVKLGKLTRITDNSGSTVYAYDSSSRLSSKTQNITTSAGTYSKTVGYSYDNANQLTKVTYPSGMEVNYTYTNGDITSVKRLSTDIISSIGYRGFASQPVSWTWGNSTTRALTLNTDNRLVSLVDGSIMNQSYTQDNVDNVTGATDLANTNNTFTANYSLGEQLTGFNTPSLNTAFTQDAKFNLQSITPFGNASNLFLSLATSSNMLATLDYDATQYYPSYDIKGNMKIDGKGGVFTYDISNNMITANKINLGTYKYNALSQRVEKAVKVGAVTTKTYYVYDENGALLGEYDASGNAIAEHVYLGAAPIAVAKGTNTYFVHTDYLGTPRAVSNSSATVVWKWDNTNAYGFNSANETVSGTAFEYNPRFAGQYFDKESGLHYNYHRMYNPELARYMQPDPIGVNGGMNIYSYVENNPLNASDPMGLYQELFGLIIHDKNKNYPNGEVSNFSRLGGLINPEFKYNSQFIYTDKGATAISVGYLIEAVGISGNFWKDYVDASYNCHGLTFLQGRGWINDDQVQKLLDKDYIMISSYNLKDNDIVIYRENNQIKHSTTISFNNNKLMTFGKDGINKNIRIRKINEQWPNATSIEFYRHWRNQ